MRSIPVPSVGGLGWLTSLALAAVLVWQHRADDTIRRRLQADADSLRAVVAQQDTVYRLRVDTVDRRVVEVRTHTDTVLASPPPGQIIRPDTSDYSTTLECFALGAVTAWRDSLAAVITAERAAADSALSVRDLRITELGQTVATYQARLDAAIRTTRRSKWQTGALVGVGFAFGLLLGP